MADFHQQLDKHQDLSEVAQKQAGRAIAGKMRTAHEAFLKKLIQLLDEKIITSADPRSLVDTSKYEALDMTAQASVDRALPNISDQLRHIEDFFRSTHTPNESPHLETMIEHLWQMKNRLGEAQEVLKI